MSVSKLRGWVSALAAALILGAALLPQAAVADCSPSFRQVNTDGFGNRWNLYSWSMQVFNGRLYVGTMNVHTGGEIWAYDGSQWTMVLSQPLATTGNSGFRSMTVFDGYLYAGTYDETYGAELWRSADGTNWSKIVSGGFGNPNNDAVRGIAIFQNQLYVGLQNASGTGGQLWRSADGLNFTPVNQNGFGDPTNLSMHNMVVFDNQLYVGTKNKTTMLQIWRSSDGTTFENVVGPGAKYPSGFGIPGNANVQHLYVYNNLMYVGTGDDTVGFSIMRSPDGVSYQAVSLNGFGDADNLFAWRFYEYQDQLWLGVGNFDIAGGEGGQVWRSVTGASDTWEVLVGPGGSYYTYGFGDWMNWGVRSFAEYQGKLYIGTAQCWKTWCNAFVTGTQVWEWSGETCLAQKPAKTH